MARGVVTWVVQFLHDKGRFAFFTVKRQGTDMERGMEREGGKEGERGREGGSGKKNAAFLYHAVSEIRKSLFCRQRKESKKQTSKTFFLGEEKKRGGWRRRGRKEREGVGGWRWERHHEIVPLQRLFAFACASNNCRCFIITQTGIVLEAAMATKAPGLLHHGRC